MSMLILGLVLVRTIFTGAIYNINTIDDKVRSEIQKIFGDDEKKTAVYLADHKTDIKQGKDWGVAFAFRNLKTGAVSPSSFSYSVKSVDPSSNCLGLTSAAAESWILIGKSQSQINLSPGDTFYTIIRFRIPESSPLCIVRFNIEITEGGQSYAQDFFDVVVKP